MIKTIIIDDEINAREFLEKLLSRYFPNKFLVLHKADCVDEGILAIERFSPEIVFLDIQMPNKNGFALLKHFKSVDFEVIFTTAHKDFAIDAIKCSALDYLLKPINYIDLLESVKRYEQKREQDQKTERINVLLENLGNDHSHFNRIVLPTESGYEFVKPNSILYCQADSNYCKVVFTNGKHLVLAKTLKYMEGILSPSVFFRIHKSYIVNLNYIVQFDKSSELKVRLNNGEQLPVSIRKKEEFINVVLQKK